VKLGIRNYELGIRVPAAGIPNSKFLILNFLLLTCLAAAAGCGRKGPPLPPLVRIPVAPEELTATRRGNTVDVAFVVPAANSDKTRPANVERVEVYALTAAGRVPDGDIVSRGERIASVDVKAPRDPNQTIDPDEPASDLQPLEGPGLDQGVTTQIHEDLSPAMLSPAPESGAPPVDEGRPLTGPSCSVPTRVYVGFGVSTQNRRGLLSRQASVPLTTAPPAPPQPAVTYDESGVTLRWPTGGAATPDAVGVLEARPVGCGTPAVGYHVYEVGNEAFETRLTKEPLAQPPFVDRRIDWGAERCYTVRTVNTVSGLAVESEPAPPVCEKFVDTFAPAPPKGLVVVPSEAAINLIWDANGEKDLAGYLVLRRAASSKDVVAVTAEPVRDTTFTDKVESGTPYVYAIQAIDANGNRSAPSAESPPESAR
jgi:predicted small lipoprotein YifL